MKIWDGIFSESYSNFFCSPQETWYPVSLEFLDDLWIPNVFIYNLKSFQSIAVLKRLAGGHCSLTHPVWGFVEPLHSRELNKTNTNKGLGQPDHSWKRKT